jgi:hypothetical protein
VAESLLSGQELNAIEKELDALPPVGWMPGFGAVLEAYLFRHRQQAAHAGASTVYTPPAADTDNLFGAPRNGGEPVDEFVRIRPDFEFAGQQQDIFNVGQRISPFRRSVFTHSVIFCVADAAPGGVGAELPNWACPTLVSHFHQDAEALGLEFAMDAQ